MNSRRESKYSEEDLVEKGVFDHIKKKVESKHTTVSSSAGFSTPVKGFFLAILLFSSLLFTGVLTWDGPFDGGDTSSSSSPVATDDRSSIALQGLCIQHTSLGAHYHYNIRMEIDQVPLPVEGNIGVESDCMKAVHTHEAGGKVHVELPSSYTGRSPTLGDFFDIWGKTLSDTNLVGYEGPVQMFLNENEFTGDFNSYSPRDGDEILLTVTTV